MLPMYLLLMFIQPVLGRDAAARIGRPEETVSADDVVALDRQRLNSCTSSSCR